MSADSICKIIQYVRQNARDKSDLWPFALKGPSPGPTPGARYFDLDLLTPQQTSDGCQLILTGNKDKPQLTATAAYVTYLSAAEFDSDTGEFVALNTTDIKSDTGDIGELTATTIECDNIQTKDKKGSSNKINITPDSVELFISAPEINKRSAYFQARNPSFELPPDYPNLMGEAIVEMQCPLYIPTIDDRTSYDGPEKYRAINVEWYVKHLPAFYNYVQRIASDYEEAAIKIKKQTTLTSDSPLQISSDGDTAYFDSNSIMLDSSLYYSFIKPTEFYLEAKPSKTYIRIIPTGLTSSDSVNSTFLNPAYLCLNDNRNSFKLEILKSDPELNGFLHSVNVFTLGANTTYKYGFLGLSADGPNKFLTLSAPATGFSSIFIYKKDYEMQTLLHFECGSPLTSYRTNWLEMTTTQEPCKDNDSETLYFFIRGKTRYLQQTIRLMFGNAPDESAIHPNSVIWWFDDTLGRSAYIKWTENYEGNAEIIQDEFEPDDPHPVRTVIRCQYLHGYKVVSECVQFDNNTEIVIWQHLIDTAKPINDNSLDEFLKSEQYQAIRNNRKEEAREKQGRRALLSLDEQHD